MLIDINITDEGKALFESVHGPIGEYLNGHVIGVLNSICQREAPRPAFEDSVHVTLGYKSAIALCDALAKINQEEIET